MTLDDSRSRWMRAERSLVPVIAAVALSLLAGGAMGQGTQAPATPAAPKAIALVAAVGAEFRVAVETMRTGSRLNPYRRQALDVADNLLNRIVLQAMDREIAALHPDVPRTYLSLPAARLDGVSPGLRDEAAIDRVVEELRKLPQRTGWDRIVVATPAYRALEANGVADKLQGLGVSMHPMKSLLTTFFDLPAFADSGRGDEALTPDGTGVRTDIYLAPYSFLAVWVLDGATLAVVDKQVRFDDQKLANPRSGTSDLVESVGREFIARQVVALIGRSIREAVRHSELAGKVDVRDVREVAPDETRK